MAIAITAWIMWQNNKFWICPIIVLLRENASYHNMKESKCLSSSPKKDAMKQWLCNNNVLYKTCDSHGGKDLSWGFLRCDTMCHYPEDLNFNIILFYENMLKKELCLLMKYCNTKFIFFSINMWFWWMAMKCLRVPLSYLKLTSAELLWHFLKCFTTERNVDFNLVSANT